MNTKHREDPTNMKAEIILCSDTHGSSIYLDELERAYPKADLLIHCGDLEDDACRYPHWVFVRGNNDWDNTIPDQRIVSVAGIRILMTHSHLYGYRNREERLAQAAIAQNCQVVAFGHTHVPMVRRVQGVLLVNPGSMTFPRDGKDPCYAKMIVNDDGEIRISLIRSPQWPFPVKKGWWH